MPDIPPDWYLEIVRYVQQSGEREADLERSFSQRFTEMERRQTQTEETLHGEHIINDEWRHAFEADQGLWRKDREREIIFASRNAEQALNEGARRNVSQKLKADKMIAASQEEVKARWSFREKAMVAIIGGLVTIITAIIASGILTK